MTHQMSQTEDTGMKANEQTGPIFWSSEALARMSNALSSSGPTRPHENASALLEGASATIDVTMPTGAMPNHTLAPSAAERAPMPNLATVSPPPMSIPPAPALTARRCVRTPAR